jgi:bacterioferritin-associated ferredoxin
LPLDVASVRPVHERRYGIIGLADPAAGYSDPAVDAQQRRITQARESKGPSSRITQVQQAIAEGKGITEHNGVTVPPGGCSGEARRALEKEAPTVRSPDLVQRLSQEIIRRAEQDSRVQAAWSKWSDCMRARGYAYAEPWDANDDPRWGGDSVTDREIATATADVACRREGNLVGIWNAVEVAYQTEAIERHAQELAEIRAYIDAYRRNVARVLAGG